VQELPPASHLRIDTGRSPEQSLAAIRERIG
jgi:hypothetical protein